MYIVRYTYKAMPASVLSKQRIYKKDAKDNFARFTNIVDRPEVVLAKINAFNLSDVSVSFN